MSTTIKAWVLRSYQREELEAVHPSEIKPGDRLLVAQGLTPSDPFTEVQVSSVQPGRGGPTIYVVNGVIQWRVKRANG